MDDRYPYKVCASDGRLLLQAAENCRYARRIEQHLLEAGCTIRLHDRKITKKEINGRIGK